ncbi:MAG TPA: molybdate ABC transporter substrate-binding protein, partial [Dehalococcoidia bacterium]|nr:molybdate ABC transporter substrate-binding protein [Dehalococcoidia bacterium]
MKFAAARWLVLVGLLAGAACGGETGQGAGGSEVRGRVTVFAAASLQDAFSEIAASFEDRHPGVEVEFNFGGSPTLRAQLEQGARADVFASANAEQMELARNSGVVEAESATFARNALVVITPSSNPGRVDAPADLGKRGLKLVLAHPDVPVGDYSRRAISAMAADAAFGTGFEAAVLGNVVSLESNVKQIVAKVELGEA